MRRLTRTGLYLMGVLLLLGVTGVLVVRQAICYVPEFYASAQQVQPEPAEQQEMSDELEREALQLRNQSRRNGFWEASFTDDELNAWAATVLPEKFPQALPVGVSDPRVQFRSETILAACQFKDESLHLDTVLSVELQVYLTDQPNQIAIRVQSVRAGWMPLPRAKLVDRAVAEARAAGIHLQRTQQGEDPVLLCRMSAAPDPQQNVEVLLESLDLRDGELYIAGTSTPAASGS